MDGTYELFRHYFAVPKTKSKAGLEVGAMTGVLGSVLGMFEGGTTHLAVATDHIIESFRNDLWPGYKSSAGIEEDLLAQFWPLEDALRAMGVVVWDMVDVEADDALAAGALIASRDKRVEQVLICTPDKDVGQCVVGKHVVQFDRRKRELRDEDGVFEKFGVPPVSIPDYLALTGDSSDGFPGLQGWGPKSASTALARFGRIEDIPDRHTEWGLALRGADRLAKTLEEGRELAMLFKDLATLRTDMKLISSVDELLWTGPTSEFEALAEDNDAAELSDRAAAVASRRSS
ncbi:MAG: 5'-3' exonuclease [Vicinamibacteria bacterium]